MQIKNSLCCCSRRAQKRQKQPRRFHTPNTVITIYIIGPVSLFRVNRTLRDNKISQYTRKMMLILLLSVQYTTLVVVRYDTIKGAAHYLYTALTFTNLLVYHGIVSNRVTHPIVDYIKPIVGVASVVLMSGFCGLILLFNDIKNNETYLHGDFGPV